MRPATVLIFAKPPRIGVAKTRLAKGIGKAAARRIAGLTLSITLRAAQGSGCHVVVYAAPDNLAQTNEGQHVFNGLPLKPQGRGGLTERLTRGLSEAPPGLVIFIGADAPGLTAGKLRHAVTMLRRHDAVFGPARDGGFWLFGLHKRPGMKAPFNGVRWSGPHALADVRARLEPGSRIATLDEMIDIDEAQDWADWTRGFPQKSEP